MPKSDDHVSDFCRQGQDCKDEQTSQKRRDLVEIWVLISHVGQFDYTDLLLRVNPLSLPPFCEALAVVPNSFRIWYRGTAIRRGFLIALAS